MAEAYPTNISPHGRFSQFDQKRWLPVRNRSGEAIPAYAAMQINNEATVDQGLLSNDVNGVTVYNVIKPNDDSQNKTNQASILFNGPITIPVDGFGQGTQDFPVTAQGPGDFASLPLASTVGVSTGSWRLTSGQPGYRVVASTSGLTPSTVYTRVSLDLTNASLSWFWRSLTSPIAAAATIIDLDNGAAPGIVINGWALRTDLVGSPFELSGSGVFKVNFHATAWSDDSNSDNTDIDIALFRGGADNPDASTTEGTYSANEDISAVVGGDSMRGNFREDNGYGGITLRKGVVSFSCIVTLKASSKNRLYLVNRSSVAIAMSHTNFTAHKIGEIP